MKKKDYNLFEEYQQNFREHNFRSFLFVKKTVTL